MAKARRQRFSHRGTQSREQVMAERRNSSWKSAEQRPWSRPPVARNQSSKIRGRQILINGYSTPAAEVEHDADSEGFWATSQPGRAMSSEQGWFTALTTILRRQGWRGLPYLEGNSYDHVIAVSQVENVLLKSQSVIWNIISLRRLLDKKKNLDP